jgi:membrane protease YdiL (CAAX protease family)
VELDAAGVFQLVMAGLGLPVLVLLWRRRKAERNPIPSGEPPVEPTGLLGPMACVVGWIGTLTALYPLGILGEDASLVSRLGGLSVVHGMALLTGFAALKLYGSSERWTPAARGPALRSGVMMALAFLPVGLGLHLGAAWLQLNVLGIEAPAQGLIQQAISGDPVVFLTVAAFGVIAAPLLEETFFRGFLYSGLRHHATAPVAAVVSAGMFAGSPPCTSNRGTSPWSHRSSPWGCSSRTCASGPADSSLPSRCTPCTTPSRWSAFCWWPTRRSRRRLHGRRNDDPRERLLRGEQRRDHR